MGYYFFEETNNIGLYSVAYVFRAYQAVTLLSLWRIIAPATQHDDVCILDYRVNLITLKTSYVFR
jgi:hypothetical protein